MGFFTLELARLVGPNGRVVAVDVQRKMLQALVRRAGRAGLNDRIEAREAKGGGMGIGDLAGAVDFVLAFAVIHELPDAGGFFSEAHRALKAGGRLLAAEPGRHVSEEDFARTIAAAEGAGLRIEARPRIRWSRSVLLARP
jgi:SAM-dependent methyltransferase